MSRRIYHYVGPEKIKGRVLGKGQQGKPIRSKKELESWIAGSHSEVRSDGVIGATFVINLSEMLLLAPRRSEHVACVGGEPVLSAGEVFINEITCEVTEITNQSTGYCPEPESWTWVKNALDEIGVMYPVGFTTKVIFRRCPKCLERNTVKDGWFHCELCDGVLPIHWNFQ